MSPGLVLREVLRVMGRWNSMYLFGGIFVGRFKCGKMEWPAKEKIFINNSVRLSMCDSPIETVKYIWLNFWCMLDWILSQNCGNTLPLHAVDQLTSWSTAYCLQPIPLPLLIRRKNIKIQIWLWFCIVWIVFNTTTTWHFHYYMDCLGKTTR